MTSGGSGFATSVASMRDGVKGYVSDQTSAVSGQVDTLKRHVSDVYTSSSTKARDAMQNASRYIPHDRTEVRSKLSNLLEEQPLILGAIGLAVGAAIGAVENVKQSAADHGLSTENLNDLVRDVGTHAKTAVNQVGGSLDANKDHGAA